MKNTKRNIIDYWNDSSIESMYDKTLLKLEIDLIKKLILPGYLILDAGCGEGEGTLEYSKVKNTEIVAIDFSKTRLKKAINRLGNKRNVTFLEINLMSDFTLGKAFDLIITQRVLINLKSWKNQKSTLLRLIKQLKPGGKIVLLEGSVSGVKQLNRIRNSFGLDPIPVKWHNRFINDSVLETFFKKEGLKLSLKTGLGSYYLLTRGIQPYFIKDLDWNSKFNHLSSTIDKQNLLRIDTLFSRTRLWFFSY